MAKASFKNARSKAQVTAKGPSILWLRQDLRLKDHPALEAACKSSPVIPVYVLDNESPGDHRMGGASLWWLHHSLESLSKSLESKGSKLILRKGNSVDVLKKLVEETSAKSIHAIRHYEPWWSDAEKDLDKGEHDLVLQDGNFLVPPGSVTTGADKTFKKFTPFWRASQEHLPPPEPTDAPDKIPGPESWPESDSLEDWKLLPTKPNWAKGFSDWSPGESGAAERLSYFVEHNLTNYAEHRNSPSLDETSRLSPHLHFGEISPWRIWHEATANKDAKSDSKDQFLMELAWRDFSHNLVLLYPDMEDENQKEQFNGLPWRDVKEDAKSDFKAWQKGETGYPVVDAAMRQLWKTGWMHNRTRMITASFLIKHLLIDWREGEKWFRDCLVDADYASNSAGWQWTSGSGVDSQMWSRIMAPITQSSKYNAAEYIRKYIPELADLSDEEIHDPEAAGKRPDSYPKKIIEHKEGRERALDAYEHIRKS